MKRQLVGVVLICFLIALPARALDLGIFESGTDATVGLWVRQFDLDAVARLVSPAGEIFTAESILEERRIFDLLIRFDSYADAVDYVKGTWQATLAPPAFPPPTPPTTDTFVFNIDGLLLETINRTNPSLVSPTPGAVIKNGNTFHFGWDYLTSGDPPRQTRIQTVPLFDPVSSVGLTTVSTPSPGDTVRLSSTSQSGNNFFHRELANVPGADKNRFLWTLETKEASLPLDVEVTLGSYVSPANLVTLGDTSGLGLSSPPRVEFYYSRQNDPFVITLSTIPEPTSVGLVSVFALGSSLCRRRWSDLL